MPGYVFYLHIEDHGEPGTEDVYMIEVRHPGPGEIVYAAGGVSSHGNLQIHPPNPGHPGTDG